MPTATKEKKAKIFNIMQYVFHKDTGERLIDETTIKLALKHKTIYKWAYILHDKDKYTAEDEVAGKGKSGELKPPHYHIVLQLSSSLTARNVAKWFNIAPNFVDMPSGWGAFWDCAEYLTHESTSQQMIGKHLYSDMEVYANFDFRAEISRRKKEVKEFGRELSSKDRYRAAVLVDGMTLREARNSDLLNYMDDFERLKKLRLQYLENLPPPSTRINYYISGGGGFGKGLTSRALARALFPDIEDDGDIFFEIGAEGVSFDGYDGQPVIIWNDCRAGELIKTLGGRGNVFNVFDTHPSKGKQNIKYGSVNLVNRVNIVNSVQSYTEFLDGLAGEYTDRDGKQIVAEDKNQSYRRFPFIIPLHEEDFNLLVNKGFFYGTGQFTEWEEYNHIRGNLKTIRQKLQGNERLIRILESKVMELPKSKYDEVLNQLENTPLNDDELQKALEDFKDFGTIQIVKTETCGDCDDELPF